ncbi:hypothetical protein LEP1GSC131_3750 [Leptospira kirschneri str. 200802841]|uniref:Uncharacterized protein n=1 Tax=Leptospira kirschneri str. 200802841 TaxID=1193047 RepID=A0A828Y1F2_9LEPT|nr:hypothetical protein LEP1GSC131_3750 [Leptospira kirschneri str. 200802841]
MPLCFNHFLSNLRETMVCDKHLGAKFGRIEILNKDKVLLR